MVVDNIRALRAVGGGAQDVAGESPRSDLDNAELFARWHADRIRYVWERRQWLVYHENGVWRANGGEVEQAAKDTVRELATLAAGIGDEEARVKALRWAATSQAEPRIRAMLALAQSDPQLVVREHQLDAHPFLLAVANGTLDLASGSLREHRAGDLITRGVPVSYDPAARAPRWERFLLEVFDRDLELIEFVQRFCGYLLTGSTREHVLAVLHGSGANGKSTFTEALKDVLGDLATTASFDTFARVRGDRGPRNDLARLKGSRLVTASESGEGRRLDEATVKEITGGDTIACRFLYGEHFEFQPEFKIVLVTNHRPRVDGDDDAIWRRLRLVPFAQSFEGREDRGLAEALRSEREGVLAWMVQGCLVWQQDGLGSAGAVTRATREYRAEEDHLGAFLADCCAMAGEVVAADLRAAYEAWCAGVGERPLAGNTLGRRLTKHGVEIARRTGGKRVYVGVSVAGSDG